MNSRIANAVNFQVGGWIAVLGGVPGHPWFGTVVVLGLVGVNVWLSSNHRGTARIVFLVGLFGTLLDSALSSAGILLFVDNPIAPWFCPPWLIALWCLLATTLNCSLQWLGDVMGSRRLSAGSLPAELRCRPDHGCAQSGPSC